MNQQKEREREFGNSISAQIRLVEPVTKFQSNQCPLGFDNENSCFSLPFLWSEEENILDWRSWRRCTASSSSTNPAASFSTRYACAIYWSSPFLCSPTTYLRLEILRSPLPLYSSFRKQLSANQD
jgi:hypothetical protein